MMARAFFMVCGVAMLGAWAGAAQMVRQPKYPLKDRRTLWSDAQLAQARENVAKYPQAKKTVDEIVKTADEWVNWSDDDLVNLITDARVPRAFAVGTAGCPKCGMEIEQKFGKYPWIVDLKQPFKVKCPVDGTVFPSNDYDAYYHSDFKTKNGWDTQFVDDGWGWKGANGEKYWFVAYWNHQMWNKHVQPGVLALGRAYLMTGDKRYAHKALVMLHRIAAVYPAMDHEKQSRYGTMMAERGIRYPGKVVNSIWETRLAQDIGEAYDDVWDTIDSDVEAQKRFGKSGREIRGFIEANFLEDAIEAYFEGKISGNWGGHQSTLVRLGLVREFGEQDQWFDGLLNANTNDPQLVGLNYALYNLIYRDGIPEETSPGYNSFWVDKISDYGEVLSRTGRDVFALPKVKRLYDGVLDLVTMGKLTPSVGDSGSVWGSLVGTNPSMFQIAYRHYHDERYARWLASFGATGGAGFNKFESLMYPPIEAKAEKIPPAKTRLLDGYGMGILNNPGDTIALSMYYGYISPSAQHGHFDRLNIDTFFAGVPVTPDLGYPDAMNEMVPGIFTWVGSPGTELEFAL